MTDPRKHRKRTADRGFISVHKRTYRDFQLVCQTRGVPVSRELERLINGWLDKQNGAG